MHTFSSNNLSFKFFSKKNTPEVKRNIQFLHEFLYDLNECKIPVSRTLRNHYSGISLALTHVVYKIKYIRFIHEKSYSPSSNVVQQVMIRVVTKYIISK